MPLAPQHSTLAVILGNRDFFPDSLITEARRDLVKLFAELNITPIWLTPSDSERGAVETWQDAVRCGGLFRAHRADIDGILICLPNFGDEKVWRMRFGYLSCSCRFLCRPARMISTSSACRGGGMRFAERSLRAITCGSMASNTR